MDEVIGYLVISRKWGDEDEYAKGNRMIFCGLSIILFMLF